MKIYKRIAALLLAAIMCLSYIPGHVHAASVEDLTTVNGSVTLDGINDGTVTVAISTHEAVDLYCVVGYWTVKESGDSSYLKLTQIGSDKMAFTGDNIASAETGEVWYVDDGFNTSFVANDRVLYATYSVAADTPAGEYTVGFTPDADYGILDTDFNGAYEAFTCKITVKASKPEVPACEHKNKEAQPIGANRHKVVCLDCGETVTESVPCTPGADVTYSGNKGQLDGKYYHYKMTHCTVCSGEVTEQEFCDISDATCTAKAKCQHCGTEYGDFADHSYGTLIPAQEAVHTDTELEPGVAAHYICGVCGKYFTEAKVETTPEALTGETPVHAVDPTKTTTETTQPTCTEEGKVETVTFCSCRKELGRETTKVLAPGSNCTFGTPDYAWAGDYSTCTATQVCTANKDHKKTETVNTTSEVTTTGTCTTKEVVTYTATFEADWADTQSIPVTGDYKHTGNCAECGVAKLVKYESSDEYYYPTLQAAVTAAKGADKVYLLKDTQENVTIPVQCNVDIYLDGHTLEAKGDGVPLTVNGANVYIKTGGTITAANNAAIAVANSNGFVLIEAPMTVTRTGEGKLFTLDSIGAICINRPGGKYSQDPTACGAELRVGLIVAEKDGYFTIVECDHKNATYSNITDTTHDWKCDCGSSGTNVEHSYDETTHQCVCGKKEKFAYTIETYEMNTAGQYVLKNTETKTADFGTEIDLTDVEAPAHFYLDGENIESNLGGTVTADEPLVLKVFLARKQYKVEIIWNGEKWFEEEHYYDTTVILGTQAIPEGYTFKGYAERENGDIVTTGEGKNEYTVTKDVTLYAVVKPNLYLLSLNNNIPWDLAQQEFSVPVGRTFATKADFITWIKGTRDPEGYHFVNFTYEDGKALEFPFQYPAQNLTIVANYEANEYTLTIHALDLDDGNAYSSNEVQVKVPYGALLKDYIPADCGELWGYHPIYKVGDKIEVDGEMYKGTWTIAGWASVVDGRKTIDIETAKMPLNGIAIEHDISFTGWEYDWYDHDGDMLNKAEGVMYRVNDIYQTGWQKIGDDWYYFDEVTCHRAEGLTRVPYPTEAINGKTYAPDQESIDYAASKGETFIDATEGWFLFGEDGKFQHDITGKYTDTYVDPETDNDIDTTRWIENGHIAWHPGMVKIVDEYGSNYYYFLGDVNKGGNILATEAEGATKNELGEYDITVTRANHSSLDREFNSGIYTFYQFGGMGTMYGMCSYGEYDSITGSFTKIRFYGTDGADKNRLMCGLGLYNTDSTHYIYVRSNGECVKSQSYWVPANDYGIPEGMYEFDENGYMIIPEPVIEKNGIYFETNANGAGWFYYVDGNITYNAGLIEFDGTWYDAEGKITKTANEWIYVRSNGMLATGKYYVTNVPESAPVQSGDLCVFDSYGILQDVKNGFVKGDDGKLYYYEDNQIAYNAGVIKVGDNYYYVRSNGQVVCSQNYWVTNVGQSGVVAKLYTFDENGVMQNPEFTSTNGIVNGYYYVNGKIAYAAGLVEYEGGYIYVRSNGKLATGLYWPTNLNGIDFEAKLYDWGETGILYLN